MSQRDDSNSAPKVWRGPDDKCCPCPYCTAIRADELPRVADEPSAWRRRMGRPEVIR